MPFLDSFQKDCFGVRLNKNQIPLDCIPHFEHALQFSSNPIVHLQRKQIKTPFKNVKENDEIRTKIDGGNNVLQSWHRNVRVDRERCCRDARLNARCHDVVIVPTTVCCRQNSFQLICATSSTFTVTAVVVMQWSHWNGEIVAIRHGRRIRVLGNTLGSGRNARKIHHTVNLVLTDAVQCWFMLLAKA